MTTRWNPRRPALRLLVLRLMLVLFVRPSLLMADGHHAHHAPRVLVAPADEIEIINPGVTTEPKPQALVEGRTVVIPPAVIVHKYYYTGDRDFRGPAFPGGPSIVVVQHPETGEQLYLDVQMLPGSPRIYYRRHAIDYRFGPQTIRIQFCNPLDPLHKQQPRVKYCATAQLDSLDAHHDGHNVTQAVRSWVRRTGVPEHLQAAGSGLRNVAGRSADGIRRAGEFVMQPIKRLTDSTALDRVLNAPPEDAAATARDAAASEANRFRAERDEFRRTIR